jgi:retron-type reverse transcriptase
VEHGTRTVFHRLTTLDNLSRCWRRACQSKGHSLRVQRFAEDALHYLTLIQQRLRDRTYTFGPYRSFTVQEKKFRHVVDAPMKDRVVHWMLYDYLLPIWQPRFISDTYGNLPGRGTHAAVRRLADFARRPANTWALQLDVSKYFHAIPHDRLKARVLRHLDDEDLRRLIAALIDSYHTDSRYDALFAPDSAYRRTAAKGMPVGNLPSQLFANIYLDDFDHWIKECQGERCYIRYVDDLVILGSSPSALRDLAARIIERLAGDGLTIHPRKIRLAPTRAGVPFLGYVIWPGHISAGQYLRRRYHYRLREHEHQGRDRTEALRSYRAALSHTGPTR